jgi:hypothetical protein
MIVWGGDETGLPFNTGGRYNSGTNSWTATNITNAPDARTLHTGAWTGSEMIVWGGYDGSSNLHTGGRYSPPARIVGPLQARPTCPLVAAITPQCGLAAR